MDRTTTRDKGNKDVHRFHERGYIGGKSINLDTAKPYRLFLNGNW